MKRAAPPAIDWKPHSLSFHGDVRRDPFYWLRGPAKIGRDSDAYDLTVLHYTPEEYAAKGIERTKASCPVPLSQLKVFLKQENAFAETFIPWRLKLSDELTAETIDAVTGNTGSPHVSVKSVMEQSGGSLAVSPLLSMAQEFPTQMISGASGEKARRKKAKKPEYAPSILETPAHYLFRELKRRVQENDASIPHRDSRYWYFTRTIAKKEYPIYCRLPFNKSTERFLEEFVALHTLDPRNATVPCHYAEEEVIFDVNLIEREFDLDFIETGDTDESPRHTRLSVAVDMSDGKEIFSLLIFDISALGALEVRKRNEGDSHKQLVSNPPLVRRIDMLECAGDCAFLSEHILAYTVLDNQQRAYRVMLHDLRLPDDDDFNDIILFDETDPRYTVGSLGTSDSDCGKRYFFFSSSSKDSSELHRISLPIDGCEVDSYSIADFVSRCECFCPRPVDGSRCEITEVWHSDIDGGGHDGWLFMHNRGPHTNFCVAYVRETDVKKGEFPPMRDLIEAPPFLVIESIEAQEKYVLISVRENGLQNCYVFDMSVIQGIVRRQMKGDAVMLQFAQGVGLSQWLSTKSSSMSGGSAGLFSVEGSASHTDTFRSSRIRFSVNHFVRRPEVWEADADYILHGNTSGSFDCLKLYTEHLPDGSYDPDAYEAIQVHAPASVSVSGTPGGDRAEIPIMLCYRRDMFVKGSSPLVLDVYGSYGDCFDAEFSRNRLSLLDRGVVCAIAWVRGGGELGRTWRDGGRLQYRENSITDLCACAEYLSFDGWSDPSKLVIRGGSAGGSVVCGAMLQKPHLFKAVMASVPFVDCLTSMLDPSIPLTTLEWEEWGNPVTDAEVYRCIQRYSPMDNVPGFDLLSQAKTPSTNLNVVFSPAAVEKPGWADIATKIRKLPHMYVDSGLEDSRVAYWEPMAFVSRIRAVTKALERLDPSYKAPLILHRCQIGAGHGGASGRFSYLKDIAREYAFLFLVWGVPVQSPSDFSADSGSDDETASSDQSNGDDDG